MATESDVSVIRYRAKSEKLKSVALEAIDLLNLYTWQDGNGRVQFTTEPNPAAIQDPALFDFEVQGRWAGLRRALILAGLIDGEETPGFLPTGEAVFLRVQSQDGAAPEGEPRTWATRSTFEVLTGVNSFGYADGAALELFYKQRKGVPARSVAVRVVRDVMPFADRADYLAGAGHDVVSTVIGLMNPFESPDIADGWAVIGDTSGNPEPDFFDLHSRLILETYGPAGPQGPAGLPGADGAAGPAGAAGAQGPAGAAGAGVVMGTYAPGTVLLSDDFDGGAGVAIAGRVPDSVLEGAAWAGNGAMREGGGVAYQGASVGGYAALQFGNALRAENTLNAPFMLSWSWTAGADADNGAYPLLIFAGSALRVGMYLLNDSGAVTLNFGGQSVPVSPVVGQTYSGRVTVNSGFQVLDFMGHRLVNDAYPWNFGPLDFAGVYLNIARSNVLNSLRIESR